MNLMLQKAECFLWAQEGSPPSAALTWDTESLQPAFLRWLSPHLLPIRQLSPKPLAGDCANKYIFYWQDIALLWNITYLAIREGRV